MARIHAHMIMDSSRWVQGTTKAGRAMSTLTNLVSGSGIKIAASLGVIATHGAKFYAEIDRESRRAVAILDKRTEGFLQSFINKSREFSRTWGVNLKEIVDASYQAFSLGKNFESYTGIMEDAIKATKTYGGTLRDNINLLLKFERVMGISSEKIMDLSATAIQLGDTKLEFLSQYMTEVTGVTKTLGIDPEELFTMYAHGTVQLRDTMKVTTGLKALLGQFLRPQSGLSKAVQETYGKSFQEAIKDTNFVDLLIGIENKIGETRFAAAVGTNVDAANIAFTLRDMPNLYKHILKQMEESSGKFAKDVEFALASPMQRYEMAVAQLNDIRYMLGQKAAPGLEKIAESLSKIVTPGRVEAFISLADALTKSIPTFALLAEKIALVGDINVGGYSLLEAAFFGSLGARAGRRFNRRAPKGGAGGAGGAGLAAAAGTGAVAGSAFGPIGSVVGAALFGLGGFAIDQWSQRTHTDSGQVYLRHGSVVPDVKLGSFGDNVTQEQKDKIDEIARLAAIVNDRTNPPDLIRNILNHVQWGVQHPRYNPEKLFIPDVWNYVPWGKHDLEGDNAGPRQILSGRVMQTGDFGTVDTTTGTEAVTTAWGKVIASPFSRTDQGRMFVGGEDAASQTDGQPRIEGRGFYNVGDTAFHPDASYEKLRLTFRNRDPDSEAYTISVDIPDAVAKEYKDPAGLDTNRLLNDILSGIKLDNETNLENLEANQATAEQTSEEYWSRGRYDEIAFLQTTMRDATPWG